MNQEQFEAACAAAIAEHHNLQEDGPLLVSVRPDAVLMMGKWIVFPTYAAAIREWPEPQAGAYGALSNPGPTYSEYPEQIIAELVREAKKRWQARQPEPKDDWREDAQQAQFEAEGKGGR